MKRLMVLVVLLWPLGAAADFYTGHALQERCDVDELDKSAASRHKYNACISYLSGLSDAVKALANWGLKDKDGPPFGTCIAEGVTYEQLRQVWLKESKVKAKELNYAAASIALSAFEREWPCKR